MLSSSLRRAVRTTTSSTTAFPSAFPSVSVSVNVNANAGAGFATNRRSGPPQQRRYSSSKPPVPPSDGSRPINDASQQQQTPAKAKGGVSNSAEQKRAMGNNHGRKASAKSRQASAAYLNLPSVPSTQDTPMQDIHLASFFSVHRPISVSTSVPPTTNDAAFNAIFEPRSVSRRGRADVLNTLTSAVASMEHALHGPDDLRHAVTQASVSNADPRIIHLDDVSEEDLHTSIAEFAKRLTPFQPPAAPKPYNAKEMEEDGAHSDMLSTSDLHTTNDSSSSSSNVRTYSTVFTIRETAYADGQRTFETYVAPLVREQEDIEAPGGAIHHNTIDEEGTSPIGGKTYIERTVNNTMYTISVRRQRKLKMKKHKFKKLLRKTRTLRRKLDKA